MSEVFEKIRQIVINQLNVDKEEVIPEANFVNDLGADDLDCVELVMQFEREFNMSIPDDIAENLSTVGDVLEYIEGNKLGNSLRNAIANGNVINNSGVW